MTWGVDAQSKISLPVVLAIAFLLAALGARGVDLSRPAPKPRPRAIVECQTKIVEEQITNAFQAMDLCIPSEPELPAPFRRLFFHQSIDTTPPAASAATPSRAPPLFFPAIHS